MNKNVNKPYSSTSGGSPDKNIPESLLVHITRNIKGVFYSTEMIDSDISHSKKFLRVRHTTQTKTLTLKPEGHSIMDDGLSKIKMVS